MRLRTFTVIATLGLSLAPLSGFKISIHKDITNEALESQEVNVAGEQKKFTRRAIDEIESANANVDLLGFFFDYFHFDNEQFANASKRLTQKIEETIIYLLEDPPDGPSARRSFGEGVHTLQDFYAHSSWIEANGMTINSDLGREIIGDPSPSDTFCPTDFSELVIPNPSRTSLTSGYFSLSLLCPDPPKGKCRHGSYLHCGDGINKDEPGRPFHDEARSTAVEASVDFYNQIVTAEGIQGNGAAIRAFLGLRSSVTIVIDTTGSMNEEIGGIQRSVRRIVEQYRTNPGQLPNFVLVPFNDPSVGPVTKTTNPDIFLTAVNALRPSGGGDCPEMAFGGLYLAVMNSESYSSVHFFSDAAPKDAYLARLVINEAIRKKISIIHVLTGTCSPIHPAYIQTAEETGGQLFFVDKRNVESVFELVVPRLEENFVNVARTYIALREEPEIIFKAPVDSTMARLVISISFTEGSSGTVNVIRPNGSQVLATDTNVTLTKLRFDRIIIVKDPIPGEWAITVNGTGSCTITVQANSPIDLNIFRLVQKVIGRYNELMYTEFTGNPVANTSLTGIAKVETGSVRNVSFGILDTEGQGITGLNLKINYNDTLASTNEFSMDFVAPNRTFNVVLFGTDNAGFPLQRLYIQKIVPMSFQVTFDESTRPVFLPSRTNITIGFIIENFGEDSLAINLNAADNLGYIYSLSDYSLVLDAKSKKVLGATLFSDDCYEGATLIITVTATVQDGVLGNSETVQFTTVCDLPPPTSQPTKAPIGLPTYHPTSQPTKAPIGLPTYHPTSQPTKAPIGLPTYHPTSQPTKTPVGLPTYHPTSQPTKAPNGIPGYNASLQPTLAPNGMSTYWIWNPRTRIVVGELRNNTKICIKSPYNIEARPRITPKTKPVKLSLIKIGTTWTYSKRDWKSPYLLLRDSTWRSAARKSLRKGRYRLLTWIDGMKETLYFNQTC